MSWVARVFLVLYCIEGITLRRFTASKRDMCDFRNIHGIDSTLDSNTNHNTRNSLEIKHLRRLRAAILSKWHQRYVEFRGHDIQVFPGVRLRAPWQYGGGVPTGGSEANGGELRLLGVGLSVTTGKGEEGRRGLGATW